MRMEVNTEFLAGRSAGEIDPDDVDDELRIDVIDGDLEVVYSDVEVRQSDE